MPIFHNLCISLLIFSVLLLNCHEVNGNFSLEKNEGNEIECQLGRTLRKQVKPTPLDGMCLKDIVARLSRTIRTIGNDELGLTKFQEMLDQLEFIEVPAEFESEFESLVDNLTWKIFTVFRIFDRTEHNLYPIFNPNSVIHSQFKLHHPQNLPKSSEKIANLCLAIENALSFDSEDNRSKQLRVLPIQRPGKICGQAGPIRNIVSILLNHCDKRRNVIILMEHGTFMSDEDIILARATAKTIVEMLSDTDLITFIGLSDETTVYCKDSLVPATDPNKYELIRRIDATIRTDTNQSIAINFKALTDDLIDDDVVIVHVTNTLKDVSNVENIVKLISSNKLTVHLRTALILSDLKPVVNVEETFINESIATLPTNNPLGYDIARLFANIKCENEHKKVYWMSDIFLDPFTKTLSVSVAHETDTALIALNIKLGEFVDVIAHFNAGRNNHAILFDKKGVVWMHKNFPRLETLVEPPIKVYLHDIENIDKAAVNEMIKRSEGMMKLVNKMKKNLIIRWKHLNRIGFIICVVSGEKKIKRTIVKSPPAFPTHILHHRLDLESQDVVDNAELCIDRRSIISLSTGTLYLPPWSSKSCREDPASLMNLRSYMKYIKDTTKLVINPGLDIFVRPDAAMIAQILDYFKERHLNSPSKTFILRRYVAAIESDVIALFPGMALDSSLDPRRRAWYGKANEHPGKIVLTGPYLDAGGAGYILSLSQTLYESRSAALHAHTDPVVAVATMDITMGYVTRLLRDMLPFCNDSMIRCFLMDDRGYLVSHPSLSEPGGKLEQQQHLTHKELLVANDILNHEFFVKKKICANYLDGTIQRYYQFNTSLEEVLTNIIHGEHCVKYQIAAVPGTNLFFGVINETCALSAFCPCSTMDRLCLNCKRMEQTECECPCECSLYSTDADTTNISDLESCIPPYEQGIVPTARWNRITHPSHLILNQCPLTNCKSYVTESECLGIVGCQWCSIDGDGESLLSNPFCSDVYLCFKGILGSTLPYSDGLYNTQTIGDNSGREWPSVGPVAGGILAIVLIFGITLFCYRLHSVQSGVEHQCLHLHGSPGAHRMTHFDIGIGGGAIDGDPIELDRTKHHMDSLLSESVPPISPYRVATNYRRPPGGDSDHGYSTMTPHDDTEQQSFAEPLLLMSNNIEPEFVHHPTASSPTTHLESPHRVLVPVTVHRNMETNYC
ncbi:hypothetical protein PV326_008544 [Microctonus aethiopoides]|nr:hypothetical protein PV326_008544 [Microctonus aethiopoides]